MKKTILIIAIALFGVVGVRAQGPGPQRSPEERAKETIERLADLQLDKDQAEKATAVFKEFYEARQKMTEEMRAGGNPPDREQMREKTEKMNADRDEKLKKIFNEQQYKKWKEEIEPNMRPQRRGGN